jgi:predicted RNA-binding protein with TRAM domain
MYGNNYGGERSPPVKEGDEFDVRVEAVGAKGDGIARKDGFVLFVPGTKAGDEVRIKVTRVLPKAGFAEKIGDAEKKAAPQRAEKPAEPEFDPQPELDSEDFGEEPAEDSADDEEAPTEEPAAEEAPTEETPSEEDSAEEDSAEEDPEKKD